MRTAQFFQWSLYLFLFFLPLQTILILRQPVVHGAIWQYGVIGWYASEVVLWACVILWFFWYWRQARTRVRMPWQWSPDRVFVFTLLVFVLFAYASAWWAIDVDLALQQARRILAAVLLGTAILFGPIDIRKTAVFFIGGAVTAALLGIWQFVFQDTFSSTLFGFSAHPIAEPGTSVVAGDGIGRWLRAYGPFSHPNVFGGYSAIAAILLLFLFKTEEKSRLAYRVLAIVSLAAVTAGIFFSFSRSAWIAWGIGLGVYWMHIRSVTLQDRKKYLTFSFVSAALFFMLSFIYLPLVSTRFAGTSVTEVLSRDERIGQYEQATALFKEQPWFGVGMGNYTAALLSRDPSLSGWAYQPVHHVFFLILVEVGVVGSVLLFLVCISGFLLFIFAGTTRRTFFLLFLPFMPLLFFDHYLWTGFSGIMLGAVSVPLLARIVPKHIFSTVHQPVIPEWLF